MSEVLIPLTLFGAIFGIAYVFLSTRNKERLALIEKGADASLFNTGPGKNIFGIVVLNVALLAIGIGIGILTATFLAMTGLDEDVAYPAMIFICGGIGLLAGFFATRKYAEKDKE